jgi:hypothetical protein
MITASTCLANCNEKNPRYIYGYMNYIMKRSKYAASYEIKRYKFAFCIG